MVARLLMQGGLDESEPPARTLLPNLVCALDEAPAAQRRTGPRCDRHSSVAVDTQSRNRHPTVVAKSANRKPSVPKAPRAKPLKKKLSVAVRPADVAWVEAEARATGVSVSSLFTLALRDLRRRRAAEELLASFGDGSALSDAMSAFLRSEQRGDDPAVRAIGDAWALVDSTQHDDEALELVEYFAKERLAGRATGDLVAHTLAALRRLARR